MLGNIASKYEDMLGVSGESLREITDKFVDVLQQGLEHHNQTVPMLPTFVFGWPNKNEKGPYLALDLGGTNLRVCHVELLGNGKFEITQVKYRLTDEQKHEEGTKLFDFCAQCCKDFIDQRCDINRCQLPLSLGFTFSYPTVQERIDHGQLIRWTKGFGNSGVEGHDCAQMLRDSFVRLNVPVRIVSIINDTTGTLIASNYVESRTKIACIFGTGCNAAYMERIGNVPKISNLGLPAEELMAINCEYGAFDSFTHEHTKGVRSKYDEHIDLHSNKPHEQTYEKMISGLYLGEIYRLIMLELVDQGLLFLGQNTYKIEKPYVFDTAFLSLIESDPTNELLTITGLFVHFFGLETTEEERRFLRRLAEIIGTRSARLSACGIAAIVRKAGLLDEGCVVGCDGSLYSKYPNFAGRLQQALVEILGPKGSGIVTRQAEDGSGAGSAVIAAMTTDRKNAGKYAFV